MKKFINHRIWPKLIQCLVVLLGLVAGHHRALAQAPTNDDFANATLLSGTNLLVNGATLNATAELPGEPYHCGFAPSHSIWYDWTAPGNGSVLIDLTGSTPGSDVSVYIGKYLTNLINVANNAGGNPDQTGRCIFQVTAGVVYEVAVDVTSGAGGSVQMALIFTTAVFAPQIAQQSGDQSVVQGGNAIFSVVATGSQPLSYQWLFQGANLNGATNSILDLTNVALNQAGAYQVVVSNAGGITNSLAAGLTVISRPPNDDFVNRLPLTGNSVQTEGTNTYATQESGEPTGGWSELQSVWWTWTAPATGIATVGLSNISSDQVLSIYTGSSLTNLGLVTSANWLNPPVVVQFVVTNAGTTYQIGVDGVFGEGGDFQLNLNFIPTNFPPVIVQEPSNQTVLPSGTATFQVVVQSALPCAFQWYFNNATVVGATNFSLTLSNVASNQSGTYVVQVSNASGTVPSFPATLTVNTPPFNDDFVNRAPIPGLSFTTTGDNQFATSEPGEPDHAGYPSGASVWWTWTTPSTGEALVNVTGYSGEETLEIYVGTNLAQLVSVTSNAWSAGPLSAHFAAWSGSNYQIVVSDPSGFGGAFQLQVQLETSNFPPTIVTQLPPFTNIAEGSIDYFTNTVISDFYVSNVWYYEATNGAIPVAVGGWGGGGGGGGGGGWGDGGGSGGGGGVGGPGDDEADGGGGGTFNLTLGVTNVVMTNSGYYYTVVTSIGGSVTSSPISIIINFPPSNDNFTNQIPLSGVNLATVGTTAYATLEPGEPVYPGLTSGGSVWWSWTAPDAGTVYITVTNTNAAFQVIQVFTGNVLTNLVSVAEGGGSQYVLSKSLIVTAGTTYQIAIAGGQSAIGLGLQFLDANVPPQIFQQPGNLTVAAGASAFFQVGVEGGGLLTYQWYFNGTNSLPGATNDTLQLQNVATNQDGYYSVNVSNPGGSTNSQEARLTITSRPPNDDFVNRIILPDTDTNITTSDSDQNATTEPGEPSPFGSNPKSVWWTWTAPSDGSVSISITNYGVGEQFLAIYKGSNLLTLTPVAQALYYQFHPPQPISVDFNATAGATFQIQVEQPGNQGGAFDLSLLFTSLTFPPVISPQPSSHVVTNENNVTFQVAATGAPPLTYQWLFDGTNLPGATNAVLQLVNVTTSEHGSYVAIVSNPGGSTNSQPATLVVLQRPPNDFFSNSIPLTGALVHASGSNSYASAEAGEPAHAGYGPFATVWWNYTPAVFGQIHMDLAGSFQDADLAIYTGTNVADLTLIASNAFGNLADNTGQLNFLGQAGVTYQIAVQGALKGNIPVSGNISLLVEELLPPTIVDQPANQYVGLGESAIFSVQASSPTPVGYQWQFGGATLNGETNSTLVVQDVQPSQAGLYSVVVANNIGNTVSSNAILGLAAVLKGEVTDAVTGDPLPGVQITVGTNTTLTDSSGDYRIAGVSTGLAVDFTATPRLGVAPLTVQFSDLTSSNGAQLTAITNGYANYTNDYLEVNADEVVTNSFSMSPNFPAWPMRFVLNWGAQPRDLDGHLLTPDIDGTNYHVYFPPQYRGSLVSPPFVELDQDATNGFGPETITVGEFFPGTYTYFVHKFAGVGDLDVSSATVAVYVESKMVASFAVPTNQTGDYWYVCDVDGATMAISPVNEVQTVQPALETARLLAREPKIRIPIPHPGKQPVNDVVVWNFGDGTTSQQENPIKTYDAPGLYSVSLAVATNGMTHTVLKTDYIQVLPGTNLAVAILAPQDGALFALGDPITITAGVTNGGNPVTNVSFYAGLLSLGAASQSPYSILWNNTAAAGAYSLTAVAYSDGLAVTSAPVNVTFDIPPAITQQPQSQTVLEGSGVNFSVTATGTAPLIYQWVFDGASLAGATDSTLALTNAQLNQGGTYVVFVSNLVGSAISSNAILTVLPPSPPQISIVAPTAGSLFTVGSPVTIVAGVTNGSGSVTNVIFYAGPLLLGEAAQSPFSFQWTNAPVGTNALTAVAYANDGLTAASTPVQIVVTGPTLTPPSILRQPSNITTNQGANVSFTVGASGSAPLAYQWQFDGQNLPGATTSVLALTLVQTNQAGTYAVIVTNVAGTALSSNALLTVNVPPRITQQPLSVTTNQNANVTFTVGAIGTEPLAYQWSFNGTTIPTATTSTLALADVQSANAGSYSVLVTNVAGSTNSADAVLVVNGPPVITQQPLSVTTNQGANVTFTVGASGTAPLAYQWQFDGQNVPGATTSTLALPTIQTNQAGTYAVIVTNVAGAALSSNALLTVNVPPSITQQPLSVTTNQNANVTFTVGAIGTEPLAYQWSFNGTTIPTATTSTLTLADVQSANAGSYSVIVTNVAGSTNSADAVLVVNGPPVITRQPLGVTTNLGANVSFTVGASGSAPLAYQWQFDGQNLPGATTSVLALTLVQTNQAGTYAVIVTNVAGTALSSNALLTVNVPPRITQQPLSVTTNQNANVTFTVGAIGTEPLAYQWSFNGTTIPTATTSTLALADVQSANAGSYSVLVTNVAGSTNSADAVLVVNGPPVITQQPLSVTTNQGANVTFTVGASGTAPLAYQWQFDGQNLSGATTSILTLPNVQTNESGRYDVVVTNIVGSTVSSNALLAVIVPQSSPVIALVSPVNQATFCYGTSIPLLASVTNSDSATVNVAFYAGSTTLLGSASTAPYTFSWSGAIPGTYSLTAIASFADGSTLTSPPALVGVNPANQPCGLVAIVRGYPDPEIGLLQSNLFDIGLTSQVFDQAGLSFDALTNYELVIWDGLSSQTNAITDNTVSVLGSLFAYGTPLYLIGENLASDTLQLNTAQSNQWIQLTSLNPATGKGGDGSVEFSGPVPDPILDGTYGEVTNFLAPVNFDLTTLANTSATVLGQSGSTVVLAANPPPNFAAAGQARIVTQAFEVGGGADPNSLAQRHTLFLNSVCWLTGCQGCLQVGLGLTPSVTPSTALAGEPVTYQWNVDNNGECVGTGTILTTLLPPGAQFVSAQTEFGTWNYDATLGEVFFRIGLLPRRTIVVSFTVVPSQPGPITNSVEVSVNGVPPNLDQLVTQVNGLSLLRLSGTNYMLELFGMAGQNYQIQSSSNLLQWLDWSNVQGPSWAAPLPDPLQTNFNRRFYRALDQ